MILALRIYNNWISLIWTVGSFWQERFRMREAVWNTTNFEKPALLCIYRGLDFGCNHRENSRLFPYRSGQTLASSAQPHYTSNKKLTIAGWRIINHLSRYSVATNMWQSHASTVDVTRNHQKPGSIGLHGSCASRTIRLGTSSWGTGGGFSRCKFAWWIESTSFF